jgi:hypothetical protein
MGQRDDDKAAADRERQADRDAVAAEQRRQAERAERERKKGEK